MLKKLQGIICTLNGRIGDMSELIDIILKQEVMMAKYIEELYARPIITLPKEHIATLVNNDPLVSHYLKENNDE